MHFKIELEHYKLNFFHDDEIVFEGLNSGLRIQDITEFSEYFIDNYMLETYSNDLINEAITKFNNQKYFMVNLYNTNVSIIFNNFELLENFTDLYEQYNNISDGINSENYEDFLNAISKSIFCINDVYDKTEISKFISNAPIIWIDEIFMKLSNRNV